MRVLVFRIIGCAAFATLALACSSGPERHPVEISERLAGYLYTEGVVDLGADARWLVDGWHQPEGLRRWTATPDATLRVPMGSNAAARVSFVAQAPRTVQTRRLTLMINGVVFDPVAVPAQDRRFEIEVPEGVFRGGLNDITFSSDRVDRVFVRKLGVYLADLRIEVGEAAADREEDAEEHAGKLQLSARRWVEDTGAVLGAGPVTIEWAAEDDVDDSIELLRYEGDEPVVVASAAISGRTGVVLLEPRDASLVRRALRTHGGSKVELTRVLQQQRVLPDIVLIVIDTWRGDHLGVVSPGLVETPNLDALAAEGVWYSAAFAHIPITGPSHASLFTGRLPSDAGVVNNGSRRIRSGVPTLAEILRAQGYQGHGTTSLTPINPRWGFGAGFATYRSETGPAGMLSSREVLDQCIQDFTAEHLRPAFDFVHFCDPHEPYDAHGLADHRARVRFNGELVAEIPTSDYTPTKVAVQLNAGRNRIDIDSEQEYRVRRLAVTRPDRAPKFNEPIAPFRYEMSSLYTLDVDKPGPAHLTLCLDDQDGTFAEVNERYAREVVAVDSAVGAVLDAVRGRGRWDETLVIVTSDHGEELGYLDRLGHVELLYDPYVHVPLIIKPPASWGWSPGERRDDLVALSDLPVAILAALEIDGDLGMTGRDVFGDPRSPVETILMETHAPQAKRTRFAVRDATTKMIWTVQGDKWEYFDLEADPRESNNLYDADDPTIRARRADLELQVQALLGTSEGHGAAEVLDEETAEILRSLGYVN